VVPFQNCVRHFRPPTKMAATAELNFLCSAKFGCLGHLGRRA
jgi:hypothetical protein